MSRLRFVHAADLHLDSPFTGLSTTAPQVAGSLHSATFDAYERIINLCISERVDALLVAGDIYDGADRSLRAQRKFVDGLYQLHQAGIRSFICHGNHDPLNGWEARLALPPTCRRFGPDFERVPFFADDPDRAVIYGISYPQRDVRENLVLHLGTVDHGPFSIGLLHANVDNDPNHPAYAPCTLADLARTGVDYWALGHVHTRRVLSDRAPMVVYPGNPQGRHPNERGERGVYLVEVDDFGGIRLDFRPVDTIRWEEVQLDIVRMDTEDDLLEALNRTVAESLDEADGRSLIVRIALTGRGPLHTSLLRPDTIPHLAESLNEEWAARRPFVWCDRIVDATASPFDRNKRVEGADFIADLLRLSAQAGEDGSLLEELRKSLSDLYDHRVVSRLLRDHVPTDDDMKTLVAEAEEIAVNLLLGEDER